MWTTLNREATVNAQHINTPFALTSKLHREQSKPAILWPEPWTHKTKWSHCPKVSSPARSWQFGPLFVAWAEPKENRVVGFNVDTDWCKASVHNRGYLTADVISWVLWRVMRLVPPQGHFTQPQRNTKKKKSRKRHTDKVHHYSHTWLPIISCCHYLEMPFAGSALLISCI